MTPDSSAPVGAAPPEPPGVAYFTFSPQLVAMESPARTRPAVALHEMAGQIIVQQVDRGRRGLAVCSPNRDSGASMIAANLAIAIAQAGVAVLLVDGNLHDPSVEALIAPTPPAMGLQQALRPPGLALGEAVQPDVLSGLSILYAGGACADASELVGGPRCADLIAECLRNYEYTIVDTPPSNRSPDARRLASYIGYGLIVGRRNRTYVDDVATLAGELADDRAELIGTIYNGG